MKPQIRNEQRVIDKDCLEFLYDEVLIYCENDTVSFSGYNQTKNPFLKRLESDLGFKLNSKMSEASEGQLDIFYFSCNTGKIKSWFNHLRNAVAHNRIFKSSSDNDVIIIEDKYNDKLSMYAEISSFEKLKIIINEIKKHYK